PTPAGRYSINLRPSPDRQPKPVKSAGGGWVLTPSKGGGIEKVGKVYINEEKTKYIDYTDVWGKHRAKLDPEQGTDTKGRHSFYIHDSQKGYSSGCHECEPGFFDKLIKYRKDNPNEKNIKVIVE